MTEISIYSEVRSEDDSTWEFPDFQTAKHGRETYARDLLDVIACEQDRSTGNENPWLIAMLAGKISKPEYWIVDPAEFNGPIPHQCGLPDDLSAAIREEVYEDFPRGEESMSSASTVELADLERHDTSKFDATYDDLFVRISCFLRERCGDRRIRLICWHC